MTKENMRAKWKERGMDIDIDCLCNNCVGISESCPWAWDLYNFGDSCLGEK
jgi:hypothetical protein